MIQICILVKQQRGLFSITTSATIRTLYCRARFNHFSVRRPTISGCRIVPRFVFCPLVATILAPHVSPVSRDSARLLVLLFLWSKQSRRQIHPSVDFHVLILNIVMHFELNLDTCLLISSFVKSAQFKVPLLIN